MFENAPLVWILLVLPVHTASLRILMVPYPVTSHLVMFNRMGTALVSKGHYVAMALANNSNTHIIDSDIAIHLYEGVGDRNIYHTAEVTEMITQVAFASSTIEKIKILSEMASQIALPQQRECRNLMGNKTLRSSIIAEQFDFAVIDHIAHPCITAYPISLGLKYFMYSLPLGFAWHYRNPDLSSFHPFALPGYFTDEMNFSERLMNTIYTFMGYLVLNTKIPPDISERCHNLDATDSTRVAHGAQLWFWPDDISLSYPKPKMPNIISIGDLIISDTKPLPDKFQEFIDSASDGVILLSMGTILGTLPDGVPQKLCAAFTQLRQKVIWKAEEPPPCSKSLAGKVLVVNWAPQNDILAHPNLKAFITHCGWNSIMEAVSHAKPMLGLPVAFDQEYNAKLLETFQYAIIMDFVRFSSKELVQNLNRLVSNETIKQSVTRGAKLFRDKPEPVEDRIDFWVNHVSKYGGKHLRTSAFKLNLIEFLLLDVYLTIFVIIGFTLSFMICICMCVCKRVSKICGGAISGVKYKDE